MTGPVGLSVAGPIATVTLAREEKRNALSGDFADAVVAALSDAAAAASIVVLRSSSPVFSSGVDLSEPMRLDASSPELIIADALLNTPLFVITVVEGPALAGGLIMAAVSPIVVASDRASFWLPERGIGIFPGRVLAFLEQVVPPRQAFWYGVTERRIAADEAVRLGLASVTTADVDGEVARLTAELTEADPAFLRAARDAWQARFSADEHGARRRRLDDLLTANVAERG